jgi:putative peptidoglycan lipid II flippase
VVRATAISMVLVGLGSILGLTRDLLIAGLFGANAETDAYLVGWMVSETASPLLIEGAMAFVMVPAFSRALTRKDHDAAVVGVVEGTLPQIALALATVSALIALFAPGLVAVLAPGLEDPALATQCMRIVSVSVVLMGLAGYMSAALRAHEVFGPPAAITVAFNVGIIGLTLALHQQLGVVAAAVGIAVGCFLMIGIQLPGIVKRLKFPRRLVRSGEHVLLWTFLPVGTFTLARQCQVFIERFLGSSLVPGTVSLLNYAQKIGQAPSTLALLIATVTFPMLARHVATGRNAQALIRLEADLKVITGFVLMSTVFLIVYAEPVVRLLFERGRFSYADSLAAAGILQVYAFGLAGQAIVDVMCRPFFSNARPSWFPAAAMGAGLVVNGALGLLLAARFGAQGIAAANAAGILVAAAILLSRPRLGSGRSGVVRNLRSLQVLILPTAIAVAAAEGVAWLLAGDSPVVVVAAGGMAVLLSFALFAWLPHMLSTRRRATVDDRSKEGGNHVE